jgi:hypothetical protein
LIDNPCEDSEDCKDFIKSLKGESNWNKTEYPALFAVKELFLYSLIQEILLHLKE